MQTAATHAKASGGMRVSRLQSHRPFVLLEGHAPGRGLLFQEPIRTLWTDEQDAVGETLTLMAEAQRDGFHLAGYVAYEAGHSFEPRLRSIARHPAGPLLCFGVFDAPVPFDLTEVEQGGGLDPLTPSWSMTDYRRRFDRVAAYIQAGDVYQVNLTFPLCGRWLGDPLALYARLRRHQPAPYGGVVSLGETTILSFSPELFFETMGRSIRVKPMKGTARRGVDREEDERLAHELASSPKNRAENLMIVDLLRNDLGRLAELGSVEVSDLFTVERYPSVLQMTSGIEARLRDGIDIPELFAALFPCGSVTGAPKIRAMEIIRELEDTPRGVYCGSIGHIRPDGSSRFNVGIRTASLASDGAFTFNVGSGIVYDSRAQSEYDECLLKARFLDATIKPSG